MTRFLLSCALVFCAARASAEPATVTPEEAERILGGPTTVTLSATDNSAQSVVEAMLYSAKVKPAPDNFRLRPGTPEERNSVTVEFNDTPFWEAARQIEAQTDFSWGARNDTLSVFRSNSLSLRGRLGTQSALVTFVANSLTRTNTRSQKVRLRDDLAQPASQSDALSLALSVFLDPKLRLPAQALYVTEASVQNGDKTLPVPESQNRTLFYSDSTLLGQGNMEVPGDFASGSRITFKGKLRALSPFGTQRWEVPLQEFKPASVRVADADYEIKSAMVAADSVSVQVSYRSPASFEQDGRPAYNFIETIRTFRVVDADGKELNSGGSTTNSSHDQRRLGFEGRYNFNTHGSKGPYTFVWDVPQELRILEVPFEFRDLPIP